MQTHTIKPFDVQGTPCYIARTGPKNEGPAQLVLLPAGDAAAQLAPELVQHITKQTARANVTLAVFEVENWNRALTPWPAPSLFKKDAPFVGQGSTTLHWLQEALLPALQTKTGEAFAPQNTGIMGYSLAGLFSLWAFYESGLFYKCASCSGSLWYEEWPAWVQEQTAPQGSRVYLSLGRAEEKARNPRMAAVGEATRSMAQQLQADKNVAETTLQWHDGGHFTDVSGRLAQALGWLVRA